MKATRRYESLRQMTSHVLPLSSGVDCLHGSARVLQGFEARSQLNQPPSRHELPAQHGLAPTLRDLRIHSSNSATNVHNRFMVHRTVLVAAYFPVLGLRVRRWYNL